MPNKKNQSQTRRMRRMAKKATLPDARQRVWLTEMQQAELKGRLDARREALDFLHARYMADTLDASSPEGKAILLVAKELAEHLAKLDEQVSKPTSAPSEPTQPLAREDRT